MGDPRRIAIPRDTFIEVVRAVADLDDSSQRESYYGWSDLLARLRTLAKQCGISEHELFPPDKYRRN